MYVNITNIPTEIIMKNNKKNIQNIKIYYVNIYVCQLWLYIKKTTRPMRAEQEKLTL